MTTRALNIITSGMLDNTVSEAMKFASKAGQELAQCTIVEKTHNTIKFIPLHKANFTSSYNLQ